MSRFKTTLATVLLACVAGTALAAGGGGGGMGGMPSDSAPAYDPTADYAKGRDALQANNFKAAQSAFRRVTSAVPASADAWRGLGQASAGSGDWKGAARAWARVAKLSPDDYLAHANLGLALANLKDSKATAELDWLKARSQACGAGCADADGLKTAIAQLETALAGVAKPNAAIAGPMLFASAGDAAYSRAVALINERRYDEALASLAGAQATFGPHPDILTYEGYAWRKKGDLARAEGYYRQALAIAPNHRGATEYYGELKMERGDTAGARLMLARLDDICAFGCAEAEELRRWVVLGGDPAKR